MISSGVDLRGSFCMGWVLGLASFSFLDSHPFLFIRGGSVCGSDGVRACVVGEWCVGWFGGHVDACFGWSCGVVS